ncbi:hypothetical protein [Trichormus variabilis]|uniref:PIN domain-containing protein n=1 Tax=Trichormus variabilis SAG 1403-4b TaxID=447716 RepID=A0A3S1C1A4_ANAVA|nr:hypothetical protein [Trichormus variabilis]MBD2624869.1 hypothetical protein [Trichormus variabilis FACHB-164]RUS95194.1 hypothetical protein DSM107003_33940 [Trichormus variabilis SAG 1403-4b]
MNKLLLDTHAFIWFVSNDANLPASTKNQIESAEAVFLSIASISDQRLQFHSG